MQFSEEIYQTMHVLNYFFKETEQKKPLNRLNFKFSSLFRGKGRTKGKGYFHFKFKTGISDLRFPRKKRPSITRRKKKSFLEKKNSFFSVRDVTIQSVLPPLSPFPFSLFSLCFWFMTFAWTFTRHACVSTFDITNPFSHDLLDATHKSLKA